MQITSAEVRITVNFKKITIHIPLSPFSSYMILLAWLMWNGGKLQPHTNLVQFSKTGCAKNTLREGCHFRHCALSVSEFHFWHMQLYACLDGSSHHVIYCTFICPYLFVLLSVHPSFCISIISVCQDKQHKVVIDMVMDGMNHRILIWLWKEWTTE